MSTKECTHQEHQGHRTLASVHAHPVVALVLVVAATMWSIAAPSSATAGIPPDCPLTEHRIRSVAPYYIRKPVGKSKTRRVLRGAELFVEAEPGLTAEWLQLTLERHIARRPSAAVAVDCALVVRGVSVRVGSGGNGFRVWITVGDAHMAEEILRRARLLLARSTRADFGSARSSGVSVATSNHGKNRGAHGQLG